MSCWLCNQREEMVSIKVMIFTYSDADKDQEKLRDLDSEFTEILK